MIKQITNLIELSRYDIYTPPIYWNSPIQASNSEYSNLNNKGPKNIAGFYFLFDDLAVTQGLATIACRNKIKERYTLSRTCTNNTVRIIDFSTCKCLHEMLDILDSLKINIYDSNIIINGFEHIQIQSLKHHDINTRIIPSYPEYIEVGWFGQMLTDYHNGAIFMSLVSQLDIDGYRWCENIDPYGLTYCFFSHEKINQPNQQLITFD